MLKSISILWLFVFLAKTFTFPVDNNSVVVLNSFNEPYVGDVSQGYKFGHELSDGQARNEVGSFVRNSNNDDSLVVKGSFDFNAPEGESFVVSYIADERGYQPRVSRTGTNRRLESNKLPGLASKFGAGDIDLRLFA